MNARANASVGTGSQAAAFQISAQSDPADAAPARSPSGDKAPASGDKAAAAVKDPDDPGTASDPVAAVLAMLNGIATSLGAPAAPAPAGGGAAAKVDAPGAPGPGPSRPATPVTAGSVITTGSAPRLPTATTGSGTSAASAGSNAVSGQGDGAQRLTEPSKPRLGTAAIDAAVPAPPLAMSSELATSLLASLHESAGLQGGSAGSAPAPAAAANSAPPAALAPAQGPAHELSADVPDWTPGLYDHVHWQMGAGVTQASICVHPRELGSVHVQVRVTADGVDVQFAASQAQVRETLAANLPQLRAMFGTNGLSLGQAGVGSQSSRQPHDASPSSSRRGDGDDAAEGGSVVSARAVVRIGLVDAFA